MKRSTLVVTVGAVGAVVAAAAQPARVLRWRMRFNDVFPGVAAGELKRRVEALRDDYRAYRGEDSTSGSGSVPQVYVSSTRPLAWCFANRHGSGIVVAEYNKLPIAFRSALDQWLVRSGCTWDGQRFFDEFFTWLDVIGALSTLYSTGEPAANSGQASVTSPVRDAHAARAAVNYVFARGDQERLAELMVVCEHINGYLTGHNDPGDMSAASQTGELSWQAPYAHLLSTYYHAWRSAVAATQSPS